MKHTFYVAVELMVVAAMVVAYAKWDILLSRTALREWAAREEWEIVESRHRNLFCGPFTWNSKKNQAVYYIKARNGNGRVRTGWVRLGEGALAGVDVEWVD